MQIKGWIILVLFFGGLITTLVGIVISDNVVGVGGLAVTFSVVIFVLIKLFPLRFWR